MSGLGQRFVAAGYALPKPLIEVDDKPIIEHVVNMFPGIDDVVFIVNQTHLETTNMEKILKRIKPDCKIISSGRGKCKGPVETVMKISDQISDEKQIIISYCDYGTYWNFDSFLEFIKTNNLDGAIPCYTGFHPHMLGTDNYAFCKEKDGLLQQIKEKEPFTNNRMSEYASNGTYYFNNGKVLKKYFQKLMDLDISVKGEYYVSLVYNLLVEDGLKVGIYEIENMLQWGTPFDLETYKGWSEYFANKMKKNVAVKNPPGTTTILPMAGKGSRFVKDGYEIPKPLLDVDGLPMVVQAVNCLPSSDKIVFVCLKEHQNEFDVGKELRKHYENCQVVEIDEVTQGQACTCELAIEKADIGPEQPIMISACDNGVLYDPVKYQQLLEDSNVDVIVWSFRNNQTSKVNPNMYSWLIVDENNNLKTISCKKFVGEDPVKNHAIIGTMFFRKAKYFLDGLKKNYELNLRTNNEFYVDDVLNRNLEQGLKVKIFESNNYICWGTPDDYKTYIYWKNFFDKSKLHLNLK